VDQVDQGIQPDCQLFGNESQQETVALVVSARSFRARPVVTIIACGSFATALAPI
jgi:hypothetical protein